MFALKLFGGLSLELDAGPVPPAALQRRRLALLALLALGRERGVSRERIQAHLWPESSPDRARHALDQLLYATRRDLGRDAIPSGTGIVQLNGDVVRPDLWAFHEAVGAERWGDAVALYAGPLLDGFHLADDNDFEQWVAAERGRLAEEYHRALRMLARDAAMAGDHAGAARWWRKHAAADPLSASVALDLMHALAAAGDRAGAIQHARIYQLLVRESLGIEPDPGVDGLATALATAGGEVAEQGGLQGGLQGGPPPLPADVPPGGVDWTSEGAPSEAPAIRAPPPAPPGVPRRLSRARARRAGLGALVVALCSIAAALVIPTHSPNRSSPTARAVLPVGASGDSDRGGTGQLGGGRASVPEPAVDPRARAIYLRARTAWERRSKPGLEEAVVLYRLATERDPTYAAAYTGLAQSYAMLGYFGFAPGDAMFPKAGAAALRALELDPAAGEAYAALGQALAWQHAWAESERAYRQALALAPDDPTVHQWYALLLAYTGRAGEAALHTGHASRLDPLSVQINNMHGMMLYYAGDLDGALRQYERTVDAEPDSAWVRQNPWVLSNFGHVAAAAGQHARALRLLERSLQVVPTHPRPLLDLAYAYVQAGDPERARAAFARADSTHPHYPVYRGLLHATLGELDEALAWFDRGGEWPLPALIGMSNDPRYAPLRADPRYQKVRERLDLARR